MTKLDEIKKIIKDEGNYLSFVYRGYQCRVLRPHSTFEGWTKDSDGEERIHHLCGYILLPKDHYGYGKDYEYFDVSVHGGLTYARKELVYQPEIGWWIGFDTAHSGDLMYLTEKWLSFGDTYKDMKYVKKELMSLVRQLEKLNLKSLKGE